MCLGGLKKCVPRKKGRRSLDRPSDNPSIESPEVLVLTMAPALRTPSILLSSPAFIPGSSATASMTQSASPSHSRWSSRFPGVISLASAGSKKAAGLAIMAPSTPALASLFRNSADSRVSPFLRSFWSSSCGTMSRRQVGMSAPASRAAILLPMTPAPRTAAFRILTFPSLMAPP